MFKPIYHLPLLTFLICCLYILPVHADPPNAATTLAQAIIAKAGIHATVCEIPRVGDGTLAAALAQQGIAQLHALAVDKTTADAARVPSFTAGVLGSRVIIETGSPSALPLGNWVADLYVVADATDKNLKALSASEAARVLSPYRGVAVVGNPAGAKAHLSKAALIAWAKATGGNVTVTDDADGLWAVSQMPALKGGDDWGHYNHDADGNPVSQDTTITAGRFNMQWHAKPIWADKFDTYVASAGRLFCAHGAIYWRWSGRVPYELETRDIYNGQVLWRRPIPTTFGNLGSMLVATPDRVYVADSDGVQVLNPETGAEIQRIVITDPGKQCRWLELADGVLVTVIGPKQAILESKTPWRNGFNDQASMDHEQDGEIENAFCEEIAAWNVADGKELWRLHEARIDPAKLVISDQHVYFYADLAYAACLDLHTGAQLWKTPDPIAEPKSPGMALWWHFNDLYTSRTSAIATKDAYLIDYYAHRQCQAFTAKDGTLLWTRMKGKPSDDPKITAKQLNLLSYPVVFGTTIVCRNNNEPAVDLLTGKKTDSKYFGNFNYGGCGHFTATASGLLFGQQGSVFDSQYSHYLLNEYSKAACGPSQFIADGMLLKVPSDCGGCGEWRGFFGVSPQQQSYPAPQPARLETGIAPAPDAVAATAEDWPVYRAQNDRRASSTAVLPSAIAIKWTYTPPRVDTYNLGNAQYLANDRQSAPPVSVGDRVWLGTAEGAVLCLDRVSGKELWRYWTAGRIMSSPSWSGGRVYVGSGDGRVYCLDAASGALLWRYRVASQERRVMITGTLSSAWPVLASPLVQDGIVYAAAGYVAQLDGARLCALDAQTGDVRWEQQFDMQSDLSDGHLITRDGGGMNFSIKNHIDTTAPHAAPEAIYQSFRLGGSPTSYTIPGLKPNTPYTIRLHLMEPWETRAGGRVMDISINGKVAMKGLDPFALAGTQNKAVVQDIPATSDTNGKIVLSISHSAGNTNQILANGFEVLLDGISVVKQQIGGPGGNGFLPDQEFLNRPSPNPPTAGGQLAWGQGHLWWKAGDWGIAVIDPASGKFIKSVGTNRGQDIGCLPGGWVATGGRQFILPPEEIGQSSGNCALLQTDAQGLPTSKYIQLTKAHTPDALPAWDDTTLLLSGAPGNNLTISQGFPAALTAAVDAPTFLLSKNGPLTDCPFELPADQQTPLLPADFTRDARNKIFNAILLKNAVLYTGGNDPGYPGSPWYLYAAARDGRKFLWTFPLPARPVIGAIAITHAGDILVPLIDGRVLCVGGK